MHPELVKAFVDEFRKEVNRQAAEQNMRRNQSERDLEKTERDIRRLIEAIKAGVPGAAVSATAGGVRDVETLKEQALRSISGGARPSGEQTFAAEAA